MPQDVSKEYCLDSACLKSVILLRRRFARVLADLGADIIKIEPPSGDPVRQWGQQVNGTSVWWSIHGRNKRSVTLNLKHPKAASIVQRLVAGCDAVVENFRPGQLAKLGLSDEVLRSVRPDLVVAHISGFGQDGPYRDRAAFGVIGEAIGGLRHLTNHPPGMSELRRFGPGSVSAIPLPVSIRLSV